MRLIAICNRLKQISTSGELGLLQEWMEIYHLTGEVEVTFNKKLDLIDYDHIKHFNKGKTVFLKYFCFPLEQYLFLNNENSETNRQIIENDKG